MKLKDFTIKEIHQGLKKKKFSVLELAKSYLAKIKKDDGRINAFLTISEESALSEAKKIDEIISKGREIPLLAGIPCAIKDNILVEGVKCSAASRILENFIAPYDATVVKKLKEQGAIILGKTNMDEFAMGSSCENSAFGVTRNPHNPERVPGGSSGGSAAAVAADFCCYGLGSDTAGSIRQPAGFCGVVGLKPTYGAVSRYGLIAMASSFDQIGPLTKTLEDCKIVFDAISGKDEMDSTIAEPKLKVKSEKLKVNELKIGVPKEYFVKGIDKEVEKLIKKAIKKYEELGARIEEISLPHTEYALAVYYIIMSSEVSTNLARYDGIRYGLSKSLPTQQAKSKSLLDVYLKTRGEGFGDEPKRRIMLGTYVLSAGYYEAYYLRAKKVQALIRQGFEKAFDCVDVIFAPVSPEPAFKIGEKAANPLTMYLSDIFTAPVNLAGLPALSLPVGKIRGLPVGLQIIGRHFEENKILEIAQIYEQFNQ